jgi:glycosyltransferase involved in cell wall biosynthesis
MELLCMTKSDAGLRDAKQPELSVIVPVYNESRNIEVLAKRLVPVLERCAASFEIIFVDDGSTDDALELLRAAHAGDPRIRALSLSRNFGKEIAITAGIDHVRGAAAIIMDADLQHPPELIETFVARWREGYKNVFAQRVDHSG